MTFIKDVADSFRISFKNQVIEFVNKGIVIRFVAIVRVVTGFLDACLRRFKQRNSFVASIVPRRSPLGRAGMILERKPVEFGSLRLSSVSAASPRATPIALSCKLSGVLSNASRISFANSSRIDHASETAPPTVRSLLSPAHCRKRGFRPAPPRLG